MITPTLTNLQQDALQQLHSKNTKELDKIESIIAKQIKTLDFHIKMCGENLRKLDDQRESMKEAICKASGAYEMFASLLANHYQENMRKNIAEVDVDNEILKCANP